MSWETISNFELSSISATVWFDNEAIATEIAWLMTLGI